MKIKFNLRFSLVFSVLLLSVNSASALGTVSRACHFEKIPTGLKTTAAAFFYAIGADESVLDIPGRADLQQWNWILESLTTDYLRVRYYLFASRLLYRISSYDPGGRSANYNYVDRVDSTWTNESLSAALLADPKFSPYYANRQLLYSARAGNPKIVEHVAYTYEKTGSGNSASINSNFYLVVGKHWYCDPVSKITVNLADSRANNCNLTNWGFGFGIFDR